MSKIKPKIIVVLGPTASGKSALAVVLARKFKGEVISADSRQVYRGLDIGTGKITKREMRGVPHHLLDVASPRRTFTAARYQRLGRAAIKKILKKDRVPIVCGGTGFYVDALLRHTSFPSVPPNPKLRRKLEKKSAMELFSQLEKLDPHRAVHIDRHNKRRLVRALEIIITTGKPVPQHSNILKNVGMLSESVLMIGVRLTKRELTQRIRTRLLTRLRHGMILEAKSLHRNGLSWRRMEELGLEYRYLARFLQGKLTKSELAAQLEKEIRGYAKRQMTWFRRNKDIGWVKDKKEAVRLASRFLKS